MYHKNQQQNSQDATRLKNNYDKTPP